MTPSWIRSRSPRFALMAVVALVGCTSAAGPAVTVAPTVTPTVRPTPTARPSLGPADVTIDASDGGMTGELPTFIPDAIEIKSGGVLRVDDTGTSEHNLTIDVTGLIPKSGAARSDKILIPVDLLNRSAEATINLPPGTYRFYCSIDFGTGAGHTSLQGTGMVGTLIVH
jgi:plastocyanin